MHLVLHLHCREPGLWRKSVWEERNRLRIRYGLDVGLYIGPTKTRWLMTRVWDFRHPVCNFHWMQRQSCYAVQYPVIDLTKDWGTGDFKFGGKYSLFHFPWLTRRLSHSLSRLKTNWTALPKTKMAGIFFKNLSNPHTRSQNSLLLYYLGYKSDP